MFLLTTRNAKEETKLDGRRVAGKKKALRVSGKNEIL
jgi:hypothetical protein